MKPRYPRKLTVRKGVFSVIKTFDLASKPPPCSLNTSHTEQSASIRCITGPCVSEPLLFPSGSPVSKERLMLYNLRRYMTSTVHGYSKNIYPVTWQKKHGNCSIKPEQQCNSTKRSTLKMGSIANAISLSTIAKVSVARGAWYGAVCPGLVARLPVLSRLT